MTAEQPFDVGLQPERTLLAWRRTALALAVASAIGIRLALDALGPVAIAAGVLGILLAAAVYIAATTRYRRMHRSLADSASLTIGGYSLAALAFASVLLAAVALAAIAVGYAS